MKEFKFDPKTFISPPYKNCPKCKKQGVFGVLMVCDNHYVRRCKECWFTSNHQLPKLKKKIIYLDQFAISNMMKVLNPKTKAFKKGCVDRFWRQLFERLYVLANMQLIVCPDSTFHTEESLVSSYYNELKRMYELLSHGLTFFDCETIRRFQITEHARNWISGNTQKTLQTDAKTVIYGKVDAWWDRLLVSANTKYGDDYVADLRKWRARTHVGMADVFRSWQTEKNRLFNDWYEEEAMSYGRTILRIYAGYFQRMNSILSGKAKMTVNDVFPPPALLIIRSIKDTLGETGVSQDEILPKTIEFLVSPTMKEIPFNKISSMLYAAIARNAAAGRKNPPSQGIVNDIALISVLLPYCDAMFIDKECHGYLNEQPFKSELDYCTRLFCLTNRDEFLSYLDDIKNSASKERLAKVAEVYGDTWLTPYTTLYQNRTGR